MSSKAASIQAVGDKAASVKDRQAAIVRAAAARRGNIYLRLTATISMAAILHIYIGMRWVWVWAAAYAIAQLFELWLFQALKEAPERALAGWRRWALAIMPAVTSIIFGALALPLFASSQRFAPTLGGMLLAGALLNVIVVNVSLRSATLAAAAPHIVYLLIVPFIGRAANPDAPLANALWFGVLLLIFSVAVAARTLEAALKAEEAAKAEAERRRHEAEEAVAAKSAFVAMISHELRTPISAILAGAARLHSEVPEASSKVHAQLIADAGAMMRTLLNDLLDFSRLEAGRMAVERAPYNLRQALADTLRLWRPEAQKKGLKLRVEGAVGLPRWVSGDSLRLRQVLNNLLSNAIKFTEQGGVTVALAAHRQGEGWTLEIAVTDTGRGIEPEVMPRMFTPFDQLNAEVMRRHGGSGLGLVISRELARLMGGDLSAASEGLGHGATMRFTLRLDEAQAPAAADDVASIVGARVLVVDDHVVNRRAIELVLQTFGVTPVLAESGEQALEILASAVFDAVLMDVYMPGLGGRETTRVLRAEPGLNRGVPVIAVTASSTPKDWEACRAAGMNAHVAKPIDPAQLHAALVEVLPVIPARTVAA
ncbi:hybrid sensor histidine kinase/response regulator [Caulobacter sp. D4A]|uniref:ATP-binding protein n=1 Tax=Caulobacter sp. D4A TaxID=2204171 RepID=UPI000D736BB3|nr:ATP-binding protein [Caulobacter sp. D4A]PXA95297.1 hybrid sensor histidine kinase/response regulator [Caulobacter sp. D4A]